MRLSKYRFPDLYVKLDIKHKRHGRLASVACKSMSLPKPKRLPLKLYSEKAALG